MESQQSEKAEAASSESADAGANAAAAERRGNIPADAESKRRRQALELQRERILSERTASPYRRSALSNALATIEEELAELGWAIHL